MISKQIFLFFASLKLAVICILGLAAVLAVGTVLESWFGMRGAHQLVYGTWWFAGVLFILGLNILCAALSRYPWKRHQIGFVVTHSGILVLLIGSFLTQRFGIDGNLPVTEKQKNGTVLLNDLKLAVTDEESGERRFYSVPETGVASQGNLMQLELFGPYLLNVDHFYPRAVAKAYRKESPAAGIGIPTVEVQLTSSRFQVREILESRQAQGPTEVSLGPAVLSFQKLWSPEEEKNFLESSSEKIQASKGYLTTFWQGREYRITLEDLLSGWQPLGDSGHSIRAEKFFTHAIVEGTELVNKSNENINPAVTLQARSKEGQIEKHTLFSKYPEFGTLHRRSSPAHVLNLSFELHLRAEKNQPEEMGIVGKNRGQLRIAQSADDKRLLYKIFSANGNLTRKGELAAGDSVPTGWMDSEFKVLDWKPAAVASEEPRYIHQISGNDSNHLSALRYSVIGKDRKPATGEGPQWLLLGSPRRLVIDNRRLILELNKERLQLPFEIELEKFTIGRDPGTQKAASYASTVRAVEGGNRTPSSVISMNEPLDHKGFTFYQASYQERPGKPYISIFSVNRDPGRWVKYAGSLLLCLGIAIMFYMNPHYLGVLVGKKPERKQP